MKILMLLIVLLFSGLSLASEPATEFNKKWEYGRLEYKKGADGAFAIKHFKRYIKAADKHWPIAELIYYQKETPAKSLNLNKLIEDKKKFFPGVQWKRVKTGNVIGWRGFAKNVNRVVEIQAWPRTAGTFGMTLSFARRGYLKTLTPELVFIHEKLKNPKAKLTLLGNLFVDAAYAQGELSGENLLFDETIMRTALDSSQIAVLTESGTVMLISKNLASEDAIKTFDTVKKQYLDLLDAREKQLKEKEKEAERVEKELQAKAEEDARRQAEREAMQKELEELATRAELIENYKLFEDKLQAEKLKIIELERMADELLLIFERIQVQSDMGATIEDLIVKYSEITGRDPMLDCIECAADQQELYPTGFMNRVLNFLHDVRQKGRDPHIEFCKQYEDMIRKLIDLEHFNQEARITILLSEQAVFDNLADEFREQQARYDQLNSRDTQKARQNALAALYDTVNRADKEWMRANKKLFMSDCREEKYSDYNGDDPLMKTSYELATEIVASHNPIKSIGDFFFNFLCFSEACKIKRACKQVYQEALMEKLKKPAKTVKLAPNSMVMRQQLADAENYFNGVRDQLDCYSRLRITYDTADFSNARHMTDPASIPACKKEGAEDAVKLYNLKKKLFGTFNKYECPSKMDSFYRELGTSGIIYSE